MEAKNQSYWWWFGSHNSPNYSPWLESTLAELNEKTKAMLKLIDQEADSFRQRAEMYYKKRPELISMVEDFYRAHRSLAERYDQLRIDQSSRNSRSPLHNSAFWHSPKNVICSVKSYDSSESFAEDIYSSEESEIDDPEQYEYCKENPFSGGSSYDELRDELERLREENKVQREKLASKDREIEMLMARLYDSINEVNDQNGCKKENPFSHGSSYDEQRETLGNLQQNEVQRELEFENSSFSDESSCDELLCSREVLENLQEENGIQRDEIELKDGEIVELMSRLYGNINEIKSLREEMGIALKEINNQTMMSKYKNEDFNLREEMQKENMKLRNALAEKDDEKREVIRQLSMAIEMLREENQVLKKSIVNDAKKDLTTLKSMNSSDNHIFKGMGLGKLFGFWSKFQTSVVPL